MREGAKHLVEQIIARRDELDVEDCFGTEDGVTRSASEEET
jgi:hypothetical protein